MPKGTKNPDNPKMTLNFRENVQVLKTFQSIAKASATTAPTLAVQIIADYTARYSAAGKQ